jgi:molybdenum cofactor biosynthesis enzyme MoaA
MSPRDNVLLRTDAYKTSHVLQSCAVVNPAAEPRPLYHVTVLSNFARGFDKYSGCYSKRGIPESTFPDRFFLLDRTELDVGIAKASRLLGRLGLPGDRLIVLETRAPDETLRPNVATGLGKFVERPDIRLRGTYGLAEDGALVPWSVEDLMARSLRVLHPLLAPYETLRPRSVSLLPVARGCQARCAFCFSRASISADQRAATLTAAHAAGVLRAGRLRGAERAVITGGGDPGLLPFPRLVELVRTSADAFPEKVVLITNGLFLAALDEPARRRALRELEDAGLTVLSLSRHHADAAVNVSIMGVDVGTERVLASATAAGLRTLRPRIVTVLQRQGVDSAETLAELLRFAVDHGVEEVTLKELYVSTSEESVYHDHAANRWSRTHHVPLSMALDTFDAHAWRRVARLPWGAPIHLGAVNGRPLRIAAYTEPSLLWERTNGLARSWNVLSDGACYASLEDRSSRIEVS